MGATGKRGRIGHSGIFFLGKEDGRRKRRGRGGEGERP